MKRSYSKKACPWDNACIESFHSLIKREWLNQYKIQNYDAQHRIPWIVFNRDQVQGFDEIIAEAVSKGIQVGWSNPCFEIWMYAYFGSMPAIQIAQQKFEQCKREGKTKPSEMCPCTTVHKLVGEIKEKVLYV